ncbi:MAG: FAD-dependent oxidoreductase [bacterium]|nr:FAD-dependent oxidoreductase [bacterium]
MAKVIFGVWDNKVIDNRGKRFFEIEESPELENFDSFDPGNPIKAFFGGKGFFVFEKGVNLLDAALQYMNRAAEESCGKCTPCRVGTQILKAKFEELASGKGCSDMFDEILSVAKHIKTTSLCGLGQTAAVAVIVMITHFRDELEKQVGAQDAVGKQPVATYVTAPCIEACPAKVDVPRYIDYVKDGKFTHSVGVVLQKYPMAATCGRVCVRFCEMACRRTMVDEAVGIKILKRFVADREKYVTDKWFTPELIKDKKADDLKVAVIGAGPAGISAAYHLLLKGYPVDIYESMTEPGGMAGVGIPEYRLPKEEVLKKEVSIIESLGGKIVYNKRMGKDFTLNDLMDQGYKSVFLGLGAHKGKMMNIPGEEDSLKGYTTGVKFLLFINHYHINIGIPMDLGEKMVVVGGGNVAMDCARSALRMGVKEVHLVYRRTEKEMPADHEEVEAAKKEGVIFHFLTHPRRIITENRAVKGLELIKMELGEPDARGRCSVHPINASEFVLDIDFVVPAIGQEVDHSFLNPDDGININRWGLIKVNTDTLMTEHKGVFAGGDCVTGPATLIEAMAQGDLAAYSIDDYLIHGRVTFSPEARMSQLLASIRMMDHQGLAVPVKNEYRVKVKELDPEVRKKLFEEVEKPISVDEAYREARRCMRCYRVYSVVTEK